MKINSAITRRQFKSGTKLSDKGKEPEEKVAIGSSNNLDFLTKFDSLKDMKSGGKKKRSKVTGAVLGTLDGISTGFLFDVAMVGMPAILGALIGGPKGALIGSAILPGVFGLIGGIDGYQDPDGESMLTQQIPLPDDFGSSVDY